MNALAQSRKDMHQAISLADWKNVARLLREEWKLRKTNSPRITTPLIEKLIKAATPMAPKRPKFAARAVADA